MVHTLLSTRNVSNRAISFFVSVKSFPDADDDEDEDKDVVVVVVCSCVNSSACFGLCRCAATREIFPEASALHRVHVEQRSRLVVKVVDKDDDDEDEDDIFSFFVYRRLLLVLLVLLRVFRMTRDSDDDDDDDASSAFRTKKHTHTRERCTKESRSRRRRRRRSMVGWTKTRDGLCISVDYKYSILKSVLVHTQNTRKVANKKKRKETKFQTNF